MNLLLVDIETIPNVAYIWQLKTEYVNPENIVSHSRVLCVSAKWLDKRGVQFMCEWRDGRKKMLQMIHKLMDEAHAVVHYNGNKFDVPVLQREFLLEGMRPPSPFKQVDLIHTVKRQFSFASNSLDHVCRRLGLGTKVKHKGMELWDGCMHNDSSSLRTMERYNIRDVLLLERLYLKLLPWIKGHPNVATQEDVFACPACGSGDFQLRGYAITTVMKYRRYQCKDCSKWFRDNKSVTERGIEKTLNIA